MTGRRQLLIHAVVFLGFFLITLAVLSIASPPAPPKLPDRILLNQSTLAQIEVPLGLLPDADLANRGYGMDGHRIAWMDERHFGDLGTAYTGQPPQAWDHPGDIISSDTHPCGRLYSERDHRPRYRQSDARCSPPRLDTPEPPPAPRPPTARLSPGMLPVPLEPPAEWLLASFGQPQLRGFSYQAEQDKNNNEDRYYHDGNLGYTIEWLRHRNIIDQPQQQPNDQADHK